MTIVSTHGLEIFRNQAPILAVDDLGVAEAHSGVLCGARRRRVAVRERAVVETQRRK